MNSAPPTETNFPTTPPSAKRRYFPNKLGCAFAVLAVLGLLAVLPAFFGQTCEASPQTKALASAKQIALALKLYAGDHDGQFPTAVGDPTSEKPTGTATDANAAFANLFPTYCTAEQLFYVPASAYCNPKPPDRIHNTKETCLAPGENEYSYIVGLIDTSDATLPLVVSGTDGTGHYVSDKTKRGGVWGGSKAIVIHVDTSGEVASLAGPKDRRFVPRSKDDKTHNLLDPVYLNTFNARLLDPAVKLGSRERKDHR